MARCLTLNRMASHSAAQLCEQAPAGQRLSRLLPLAAIYFAIVAATHYAYFGDTMGYVQNILAFDHDPVAGRRDFWDFGHLLWRPFGWLLFRAFGDLFPCTKARESKLTL